MSSVTIDRRPQSRGPSLLGEPAWDVALLFPSQGDWTEDEYLALDTNRLIELSNGRLEVLPMPTPFHQSIAQYLFELLKVFVMTNRLGEVFLAPLPIRLAAGRLREPDVLFLRPGRILDRRKPPEGADLAMEVVSDGEQNRVRDLVTKRDEYFVAGVQEYWIVDPEETKITVLKPGASAFEVHGEWTPGQVAQSSLLAGFSVDVASVFTAGEGVSQ